MTILPTVDGIASAASLILATIASLRAASRLERRLTNHGSIGLMDGPPILGPLDQIQQLHHQQVASTTSSAPKKLLEDNDRIDEPDAIENDDEADKQIFKTSPLWEHAEAFRHAAILGLLFDEANFNASPDISNIFTNVIRNEGKSQSATNNESEEDLAIAAAVEAGLLVPTRGGGGTRQHHSSRRRWHRIVRGGGASSSTSSNQGDDTSSSSSSNPLTAMTSWFIREISAPFAAIPAWHGMLYSYLREQRETSLRKSQWRLLTLWERLNYLLTGRADGRLYDPSGLDFDASLSAMVHVPCVVGGAAGASIKTPLPSFKISTRTRAVRVKAYAPRTFRDLRNKCFRVNESEYAQSILNAMDDGIAGIADDDNLPGDLIEGDIESQLQCFEEIDCSRNHESTISKFLESILSDGNESGDRIRQNNIKTLPYISFQSNSKGAARAGTFFFFTADGAYMVKTVKKDEALAFLEMLPEYHKFMSEGVNGRNSLLTRVFGMYSVQFAENEHVSKHHTGSWNGGLFSTGHDREASESSNSASSDERVFLVMNSVFPAEASAFVTERFDLKGSTVGRECSPEERKSNKGNAVLKDLDLKREVDSELDQFKDGEETADHRRRKNAQKYGIHVGARSKAALMAQLERDVDLLNRCGVLDYSLLVGVADMEMCRDQSNNRKTAGEKDFGILLPKPLHSILSWVDFPLPYYGAGITKVDGGNLSSLQGTRRGKQVNYYLGVIDFLQPWTMKKRLERDLKGLAGFDIKAISCVAPADYASRFLKFVDNHVT